MPPGSRNEHESAPRNAGGQSGGRRRPPVQDRQPRAADLLRPAFKRSIWSTYDHIGLLAQRLAGLPHQAAGCLRIQAALQADAHGTGVVPVKLK